MRDNRPTGEIARGWPRGSLGLESSFAFLVRDVVRWLRRPGGPWATRGGVSVDAELKRAKLEAVEPANAERRGRVFQVDELLAALAPGASHFASAIKALRGQFGDEAGAIVEDAVRQFFDSCCVITDGVPMFNDEGEP